MGGSGFFLVRRQKRLISCRFLGVSRVLKPLSSMLLFLHYSSFSSASSPSLFLTFNLSSSLFPFFFLLLSFFISHSFFFLSCFLVSCFFNFFLSKSLLQTSAFQISIYCFFVFFLFLFLLLVLVVTKQLWGVQVRGCNKTFLNNPLHSKMSKVSVFCFLFKYVSLKTLFYSGFREMSNSKI